MKGDRSLNQKLLSFNPVLPATPKVLIVGSMPSKKSLEQRQYYGHPRNHFWPIIYELFNEERVDDYMDKIALIKRHGIALWDTIGACYREGSLDTNILDEEPNDIVGLLRKHPTIKLIACNGTKSFQTFNKYVAFDQTMNIDVIKLSSSSPIPGRYTKTFVEKVEEWKQILDYL